MLVRAPGDPETSLLLTGSGQQIPPRKNILQCSGAEYGALRCGHTGACNRLSNGGEERRCLDLPGQLL